jgi:hypothetical protein
LPFIPGFNYLADLIFTESCRAHTIFINGKKVIEEYKLKRMNEDRLKARAKKIADRYYNSFRKKIAKHL